MTMKFSDHDADCDCVMCHTFYDWWVDTKNNLLPKETHDIATSAFELGFTAGQKAAQFDLQKLQEMTAFSEGKKAAFEEVIDYVIDMNSMSITLIQKKIIDWIEEKLQAAEGGKK